MTPSILGCWSANGVLRTLGPIVLAAMLAGCTVLEKPVRALVYDFGPGAMTASESAAASRPRLILGEVEAPSALEGTALLYRLAFSNPQQLLPYSQARWSMPPAQLVRLRLHELFGRSRLVLGPTDAGGGGPPGAAGTLALRIELEEFSHYFESAQSSFGLLRLRATVSAQGPQGERVLGQRLFVVRQPANSGDAAGGARALAEAVAAVAQDLDPWISQLR
jgi:cholesterol transport system auxiliary component